MSVVHQVQGVLQRELDELAALRSEIGLKAHLAKADARTQLDRLEKTWERLQEEARRIHPEPANVRSLFEQVKTGYENVKRQLTG